MEKRFFVNSQDIFGDTVIILGDEHKHLAKVLRLSVGDKIECFFDASDIFLCTISKIEKDRTLAKVDSVLPCSANPTTKIILFQGLPKLDKLELISQKLCEIGVSEIVPFSSQFCVAKPNENKTERLEKIVISACKQCGRTQLLKIHKSLKFAEMLDDLKSFDKVIFANETEKQSSLRNALATLAKDQKIAVVVGSEGGFSRQEIDELCAKNNVCSVSLGTRILRTETASILCCGCVATAVLE
jgi:16S rRNA (uracil1498-N3)-methyltransferase